jgi:leucyl/phenylalanyl-tRNA--protein transferase
MPDPGDTVGGDIVAIGLDLKPETLLLAYSRGVFPWPSEGLPTLWYSPRRRAVLDFDRLHIPSRLKRFLRKQSWTYTIDSAFNEVIEACSIREDEGTWILPEMKAAYCEFHRLGHAHSIEVWEGPLLIGGLYGVDVGGYFAGESMFHRKTNASKAALLYAIALQKQAGRGWMDIQVMSSHMEAFGAHEISRKLFKNRLEQLSRDAKQTKSPFLNRSQGEPSATDYGAFCSSIE